MKTFLAQTENGIVVHDFVFTLAESVRYTNWYRNEKVYSLVLSDSPVLPEGIIAGDVVPVGSIEYVLAYAEKVYGIKDIKPLNIPEQLNRPEYIKRSIWNYSTADAEKYGNQTVFVKSKSKFKGITECLPYNKIPSTEEELFISEYIDDIQSEWRAFIYRSNLVGLQNYSGNFTVFPDTELIKNMITDYPSAPPAYTIDVGISENRRTFLIECHEFFSCGLYGFADHSILPQMFIVAWNYIKEKAAKSRK